MLEQKNHLAEEEAELLSRKVSIKVFFSCSVCLIFLFLQAMEVEQEILKLKNYALKTEEEKIHLERKFQDFESLTARLGILFLFFPPFLN